MIGLFRAFAWLRWRLFLNSFRGSRRRDGLERFSRIAATVVPIVLFVLFIPSLLASAVLGVLGGWAMGTGLAPIAEIALVLRIMLGLITVVSVFAPALRSIRGSSSSLSRFMLLPIPTGLLFVSDALSGLSDPWILLTVPILLLLPVGIAISGHITAAGLALLAGVFMLAFLLGLESAISHGLSLLYRNRRRGEAVTLAMLVVFSMIGFVPMLITMRTDHFGRHRPSTSQTASSPDSAPASPATTTAPVTTTVPAATADPTTPAAPPTTPAPATPDAAPTTPGPAAPASSDTSAAPATRAAPPSDQFWREVTIRIPVWIQVVPSDLYGRTVQFSLAGKAASGVMRLGALLLAALIVLAASRGCYVRLLNTPEVSGAYGKGGRGLLTGLRVPGLSPSASAVALAYVRLVTRSITGKMAIYFSPLTMVLLIFILTGARGGHFLFDFLGTSEGPAMATIGMMIALATIQRIMLNQFAVDGAGLTLQLLAPISSLDLVLGKAAGMAVLYAGPSACYLIVAALFTRSGSLWLWMAVPLTAASAYMLFSPIAAILSALFPKTADLNRIGKSNNPNSLAAFIGFFVATALFVPPAALAALGMFVFDSPALALVAVIVWLALSTAIAIPLFRIAARVVEDRRENMALVAQGR